MSDDSGSDRPSSKQSKESKPPPAAAGTDDVDALMREAVLKLDPTDQLAYDQ